jgi:hypothetical protein
LVVNEFRNWVDAFGSRSGIRELRADQYRENELQSKLWMFLKRRVEMVNRRAVVQRNRKLLGRGFLGMRMNWERQRGIMERRAQDFRELWLKRMLWGLLKLAVLQSRENPVDRAVSSALREQRGGRYRTRIVYI